MMEQKKKMQQQKVAPKVASKADSLPQDKLHTVFNRAQMIISVSLPPVISVRR